MTAPVLRLSRHVSAELRTAVLFLLMLAASIVICLALMSGQQAQDTTRVGTVIDLPLDDPRAAVFFGAHAEWLKERETALTLEEVRQRTDWQPVGQDYMSFGALAEPIWLRASVRNTSDQPIQMRLDTRRVAFWDMDIWTLGADGARQILDYHYQRPFQERPVQHRFVVADGALGPGETRTVYVRYLGIYNTVLPLRATTETAFLHAESTEIFWSAVFYGANLAALFLVLITVRLTGWRLAASFVVFLLTSMAAVLSVEGYIDQYLIPVKSPMATRLTDAIYLISYASVLVLGREIFRLRNQARRLDAVVRWVSIGLLGIALFHLFVGIGPRVIFVPVAYGGRIIAILLHAAIGVWAVHRQEKGGLAYALSAVTMACLTCFLFFMETFAAPYGGIPSALRTVVTIEIMAFAAAIVQQLAELRRDRDRALKRELASTQEQLRLSEALQKSRAEYQKARGQAASLQKRLRAVSHDMMQPLAALKRELSSSDDEAPATGSAQDAVAYLEALTQTYTVPDAAPADDPALDEIPVATVVKSVAAMFSAEAEAKGLSLEYDCDPQATGSTRKPVALMRAVSNLVANAVRHTEVGKVRIQCQRGETGVSVVVEDTGCGMSADELAYFAVDGQKGPQSGGQGLGMGIVREAARLMGARLDVQSRPGHGTQATLHLPDMPPGND